MRHFGRKTLWTVVLRLIRCRNQTCHFSFLVVIRFPFRRWSQISFHTHSWGGWGKMLNLYRNRIQKCLRKHNALTFKLSVVCVRLIYLLHLKCRAHFCFGNFLNFHLPRVSVFKITCGGQEVTSPTETGSRDFYKTDKLNLRQQQEYKKGFPIFHPISP